LNHKLSNVTEKLRYKQETDMAWRLQNNSDLRDYQTVPANIK